MRLIYSKGYSRLWKGLFMIININGVNKNTMRSNAEINSLISSAITDRAKIKTGSYAGTGLYGETNKTTINVGFTPKFVFILADFGIRAFIIPFGSVGVVQANSTMNPLEVTQITNGVTFYSTVSANYQMNSTNETYYWIALG